MDADFPRHAQRFTTGSDAPGYTLETLLIGFYRIADRSTPGSELTVTLNEESNGNPGTALCTLINPSSFGGFGMHSFSAPNTGMDQCPALRANTTYFAVIERAKLSTSAIELSITRTYDGDSNSLEGWLIGNGAHHYVSANTPPWTHSSDSPNLFFRVHGVGIPHPPRVTGFDLHSDNDNPKGIWGNDDTFWVSQNGTTDKLFAYNRSDGSRDSSQDFNTLSAAGNGAPTGLCSDGTTMFVADYDDNKVYAYTLSTGAHDSAKDITLHADNNLAEGLWCDVTNVWVVDDDVVGSNDIFAYNRADGTQNTDVDFLDLDPEVMGSPLNANPRGIYSNGETMFVVDDEDATVYAWNMSDQMRDEDKEIALDVDNADPEGLWFDGRVLWVVDDADDRVYVYDLPGAQPGNNRADGVPGVRTPTSKDVWAATLTVGDGRIFGDGYISSITPLVGSLSPGPTFTLDGDTYTVINLSTGAGGLAFGLDKEPPREFTLSVGGESFVSPGSRGNVVGSAYGYIWHDVNLSWPHNDTISVVLSVDYAPKKGGELTADVSGIRDSTDGVANAFFHYQWVRVDGTNETELDGETGPTYTPTDDDVGKHLKVRVVFDDDADNKEYPRTSLQVGPVGTNSSATGAPAITGAPRAGGMLTVDLSGITDPEGTDDAEFTYQWISIDGDSEADIPNATRAAYRPIDEDAGKNIRVRVSFIDNEGFPEGPLTSEPTDPIVAADVLVKNTGQTSSGSARTLANSRPSRAQAFTTGRGHRGLRAGLHRVPVRQDRQYLLGRQPADRNAERGQHRQPRQHSLHPHQSRHLLRFRGTHLQRPDNGNHLRHPGTQHYLLRRNRADNGHSRRDRAGKLQQRQRGPRQRPGILHRKQPPPNQQHRELEQDQPPVSSDRGQGRLSRRPHRQRQPYLGRQPPGLRRHRLRQHGRLHHRPGLPHRQYRRHLRGRRDPRRLRPRAARHRQDPGTHRRVHRARRFLGVRHAFRLLEGGQLQAPNRNHRRYPHLPTDVRKRCTEGQHQLLPGHRINQRRLSRRGHHPHDRVRRRRLGRRLDRR